jgi:3'-phosphoadenosine 5'-phosphosulfate sulfotransferase (PAPS reductase)/FAD synthetase
VTDQRLVVLSLSGGKDSAAAALYLREQGIEHVRVFMDTGWEHPDLYAHLDYLEAELGPIVRLAPRMPVLPPEVMPRVEEIEALVGRSPSGFVRWAVSMRIFPSRMRRYCTRELKVRPFLRWVDEQDDDILNVVGIRASESAARANLPEREAMPGAEHVEVWRPLIHWTEADVIAIHQRHGLRPCPLYLRGATRVGCWPCIMANKGELALLGKDDRRVAAIRALEALMGDVAAARASNSPGRPAMLQASTPVKTMFQASTPVKTPEGPSYPPIPIDDVLTWARTERGGRQMRLGDWGREDGCVRWGMCDTGEGTP